MKLTTESQIRQLIAKANGGYCDTGKSIVVYTKTYGTNWCYDADNKAEILASILANLKVRQADV